MTVSYTMRAESFLPDKPRVWAENARGAAGFDIAPDGKQLAINVPATTREVPRQEHTVGLHAATSLMSSGGACPFAREKALADPRQAQRKDSVGPSEHVAI